ncbi:hypothetical protein VU08_01790 [Desulfobulbus sp. F5]|nr:hypothetical protein [Desulfobulbus sp. F5]
MGTGAKYFMKRKIQSLRNLITGDTINADKWLASLKEPELFVLRGKLKRDYKESNVEFVCEICNQPVYLVGNIKKEHYFKHWQELGDCPIKTSGKYSQKEINRMKYNGAKESKAHIEIKEHLYKMLSVDHLCSQVNKEKVVKSIDIEGWWKKPDISLFVRDNNVVIEIQLSTTYLDVIVDRTLFYEKNETMMLWVFAEKAMQGFRFTEKDIFYNNKRNAFVITSESKKISKENGRLHLLCCYQEPSLENDIIKDKWTEQIISIEELKFDKNQFKVYYFNYEQHLKSLKGILLDSLSKQFESFWVNQDQSGEEVRGRRIIDFIVKFNELGIEIKEISHKLFNIISALYSLKHGKVIKYRFPNLLGLTNMILEEYKDYTYIYLWAIHTFNRSEDISSADSFKRKVERYKEEKPLQNKDHDNFLAILFPELSGKIINRNN